MAQREGDPLRRDPVAAAILPFILFMIISTVVSALAPHPDLGYPVKALALLGVVLIFLPAYRLLIWRPDPLALVAGLAVGIVWVVVSGPGDPELAAILAAMTPESYASWILLRLLGTALLVPLVEEMFFRGYVLIRLDGPGWRRIAAVAISSLAFGALHGRWVEAGVAGVIFAALALRRGRVTDAVLAHVTANVLIGVVAAWQGDFSLI
jgi:exosortase E/protease (VPEID-CTERM system)